MEAMKVFVWAVKTSVEGTSRHAFRRPCHFRRRDRSGQVKGQVRSGQVMRRVSPRSTQLVEIGPQGVGAGPVGRPRVPVMRSESVWTSVELERPSNPRSRSAWNVVSAFRSGSRPRAALCRVLRQLGQHP
jgi:hypothetical protein